MLTLETVLEILYKNDLTGVVVLGMQIDGKISFAEPKTSIAVEIRKENLPANKMFVDNKSYGYVECPVIHYDKYKLDKQYTVLMPNGKTTECRDNNYSLTAIVDSMVINSPALVIE